MCTIQFVGTQNRFTMLRCLMSGCCGLAEKKLKYTSKKCTLTQIHNSTTLSSSMMTLGIQIAISWTKKEKWLVKKEVKYLYFLSCNKWLIPWNSCGLDGSKDQLLPPRMNSSRVHLHFYWRKKEKHLSFCHSRCNSAARKSDFSSLKDQKYFTR